MNRLFIWIISAFIVVSFLSMVSIPIAQRFFVAQTLNTLNPDFKELIEERTKPPIFIFRRGDHKPNFVDMRRNHPNLRLRDILQRQNESLFELFANYRFAQRKGIWVGILAALALSFPFAYWLARLISKPIEAVSRAAHNIAAGDLSARVQTISNQAPQESIDLASSFNKMADGLERYEGERSAMFADIAHELKNPLATLRLRMDAISDGLVKFNSDELKLLSNQVDLLSRLTEDLRTLSLADHGKISLNKNELNFVELVDEIVKANWARANRNNINLSFVHDTGYIVINADPHRLSQVINNLIDNAFKATREGAWIKISLNKSDKTATLIIQDSGSGFSQEQLSSIFTRFKKGQRRDLSEKSSGLGLAIAKALIELHGGTIKAQNHTSGAEIIVQLKTV